MIWYVIFIFAVSFALAQLEINIEGKHGWAEKLPTWRVQNSFTEFITGPRPITGYHVWLMTFILIFLHLPYVYTMEWSLGAEMRTFSIFIFIWLLEDFQWFIFNPYFGIKKFNKKHANWHNDWLIGLPLSYFKYTIIAVILWLLSYYF